jgi:hypothetical protein
MTIFRVRKILCNGTIHISAQGQLSGGGEFRRVIYMTAQWTDAVYNPYGQGINQDIRVIRDR